MTEEEAKTKWCPFARVGSSTSGLGGFNRFIEPVAAGSDEKVRCIGSACMAWRWDGKDDGVLVREITKTDGEPIEDAPPGFRWRFGRTNSDRTTPCGLFALTGYCGLAFPSGAWI